MSRLIALYEGNAGRGELAVMGSRRGLERLAAGLRNASPVVELELGLPSEREIGHHSGFFTSIRIIEIEQLVEVGRDGFVLCIRGSKTRLEIIAGNIDSLLRNQARGPNGERPSDHLHVDYHPNHYFLQPTSEPLIIYLWRAVGTRPGE